MSKSDETRQKIYEEVIRNGPISSGQIASSMSITRMTAYRHLNALVEMSLIQKVSDAKKTTRYFKSEEQEKQNTSSFTEKLTTTITQRYQLSNSFDTNEILNESVALEQPDGRILLGIEALYEKIQKEQSSKDIPEDDFFAYCCAYFDEYFSLGIRRRPNGFFDGSESLTKIMRDYEEESFIDTLLFCAPGMVPRFGRTATSIYLGLGKERSSKILLNRAINIGMDAITQFIRDTPLDYIVFAPPTLERKFQFRDVLNEVLEKKTPLPPTLKAEKKIKIEDGHYMPQKRTKGKDRIINARESMEILLKNEQLLTEAHHILIFDDNFTTGATVNFLAEKIRQHGFTGKITSINITGAFYYEPGVTDEADV